MSSQSKVIDMIGKTFNQLTVISYLRGQRVLARCVCGSETEYNGNKIKSGHTAACSRRCNFPNLCGKVIGLWSVISRAQAPDGKHGQYWNCECSNCHSSKIKSSRMLVQNGGGCPCTHRAPPGRTALRYLILRYKISAKKRGFDMSLSDSEFKRLFSSNCFYCGIVPSQVATVGKSILIYNGIDRLNSSVGYVIGNVEACCKNCNLRKGKLTSEEFKAWIVKVFTNFCVSKS